MPSKILVVDDEPDLELLMRQRFRRAIRAGEMTFCFARNGLEALDALRADSEIAIVLTDINMPQMDGLTFLHELEKHNAQVRGTTKAVVVSAYSDMENIRTAMNRGAFDFLTKPIDFEDVEITIFKTLRFVHELQQSHRAEEYRIAKEVAEANFQKLRELELLRDSLVHMIVHDLRTPLTSFTVGLQSLSLLGQLNTAQQDCLTIALSGGSTLLRMVNDLLDVSRMEEGSLQLSLRRIEPLHVMQRAASVLQNLAQQKNIHLQINAAPDLPALAADEELLGRILVNLLSNAIKFTDEGGHVTLAARHKADSQRILFSVSDTGRGIPEHAFGRIFEKFGRVELEQNDPGNPIERLPATGLGLTFCKMAVEAHGGRIWVESEVGRGSCFCFELPLQPAST